MRDRQRQRSGACRVATFASFQRISRGHGRMAHGAGRARSLVVCLDFHQPFHECLRAFVAKTDQNTPKLTRLVPRRAEEAEDQQGRDEEHEELREADRWHWRLEPEFATILLVRMPLRSRFWFGLVVLAGAYAGAAQAQ